MSLTVALNTAASGLLAAQAGLQTVSDNIANVNTPGYVRKTVIQQQLVVNGMGQGVNIAGVQRVTDQYLQSASLTASSGAAQWSAYSTFMDNAQALFGNPSGAGYFFNDMDRIYSSFGAAANDPSSSILRTQALSSIQDFLGDANRINTQIGALRTTVDSQVNDDVSKVNGLLSQISALNADISRANVTGGDSSGSQNIQGALLNQLAALLSIKVTDRPGGGVTVRSPEGTLLAGDAASTLSYSRTDTTSGYISAQTPGGGAAQPITIAGGELAGLLELRNNKLSSLSDQLGEFVQGATDRLNAAHNAATSVPAPTILTGRNTGLNLPTAVSGFSGASTIAILNSAGVVQRTVAIDFTGGTMSVNGGAGTAFTPGTFLANLNTALGASGAATFTNGVLSIAATGTDGVAIDEGTSMKAGKAFSHFFGLNDIVRSSGLGTLQTGLTATDTNGFTPGDTITLALATPDGKPIRNVTVAVPAAGSPTVGDLVNALNNNATGVGLYGSFTLDANGGLTFTGTPPANATLSIAQDNTQRGVGGPSISQLFGLGVKERSSRASDFFVAPPLMSNPTKLALGKLDLSVAAGTPAISAGDGSGALALSASGSVVNAFGAAGSLGQVNLTVSAYAAEFGGSIGRDAAAADDKKSSHAAVQTEADARRASVEGVNIDEELVRLTTYQQAYNASARMIQASRDLFDALLAIIP